MAGATVALLAPTSGQAQDIEAVARARGIELPAAYYDQIARDPTAYTFRRALFNRTGLHPLRHGPVAAPARTNSSGEVALPVVLALFSDSPDPHITRDDIDASLFAGPSARGTVTDAYLEMSRGALEVNGDVFDWVRTGLTLQEVVGDTDGLGGNSRVGEFFLQALQDLDADVDWSHYDNDGPDGVPNSGDDDGYVDVVTFEYLEVAASCGGPAIWPHRWRMSGQNGTPFITDDPAAQDSVATIRVEDYITQSVADCTGQTVQDASTIAHEFGHALGLPDYYHPTVNGIGPEGRRWVMGCWALMAGGAWGCGPVGSNRGAFGPTHMMAHSKYQLGWVEYVDPGEVWNEEVVLEPVQTSGRALRIPVGSTGSEFLIAEYRTRSGFDAELPAEGVVFYKLDENAARRPDPTSGAPYYLTLLEQDGDGALMRNALEGGDRGVPADAWGVGGLSSPLNGETIPALLLSAGGRTPVAIHEVVVANGVARLVLSTGATPRLVDPAGPLEVTRIRSFLETVRIAGGTGPYTVVGTPPAGLFFSSAGDELLVGGAVFTEGPHEVSFAVRDAQGAESNQVTVTLVAPEPWVAEFDRLLQSFLVSDAEPLTPGELAYLDQVGNADGAYDVGDLRKWLREQGTPND